MFASAVVTVHVGRHEGICASFATHHCLREKVSFFVLGLRRCSSGLISLTKRMYVGSSEAIWQIFGVRCGCV